MAPTPPSFRAASHENSTLIDQHKKAWSDKKCKDCLAAFVYSREWLE